MNRIDELTMKWIDGQLSDDESAELDLMLERDPAAKGEFLALVELESGFRRLRPAPDVARRTMDRLYRQLNKKRRLVWISALSTAAALLIAFGVLRRSEVAPPPPPPAPTEWVRTFSTPGFDQVTDVRTRGSHSWAVAQVDTNANEGRGLGLVMQMDGLGNVKKQSIFGKDHVETYVATVVEASRDGGAWVAGLRSLRGDRFDWDPWVLRVDAEGRVQWQNVYPIPRFDECCYIAETSDGGALVTGTSNFILRDDLKTGLREFIRPVQPSRPGQVQAEEVLDPFGTTLIWVFKLDARGNIEWQKFFDTYRPAQQSLAENLHRLEDEPVYVEPVAAPLPDGGCILSGDIEYTQSRDAWLARLDRNGNVLWQKAYGGTGWDRFQGVEPTDDGGFLAVGSTTSFGSGSVDGFAVKVDGNGDVEWQYAFGGPNFDRLRRILKQPDGFVLIGTRSVNKVGHVWLLKLNRSGDVLWDRSYSEPDNLHPCSLAPRPSGGFWVTGRQATWAPEQPNGFLMSVNSEGLCPPFAYRSDAVRVGIQCHVRKTQRGAVIFETAREPGGAQPVPLDIQVGELKTR